MLALTLKENIFYTFGGDKLYSGPFKKSFCSKLLILDPPVPCLLLLVPAKAPPYVALYKHNA